MNRVNVIALVILAAVVVWIFTLGDESVQNIQRGFLKITSPIIGARDQITDVSEDAANQMSRDELIGANERLRQELRKMRILTEEFDRLRDENRVLRNRLKLQDSSPFELVAAEIMGRESSTWYHTLIINKGSEQGIASDDPVLIDTGLVGKVILAAENSSTILLLTDEACKVAARVVGTPEQGLVSGERGAVNVMPNLYLRHLSRSADVRPGMDVISSGAGGVFPPNLPLGTIREVHRKDITTEAELEPAVDFSTLEYVFVIIGMKQ